MHPIEGPAREMAWGGAHGILASISSGVGADYQAGFGLLSLALRQEEQATTTVVPERELERV